MKQTWFSAGALVVAVNAFAQTNAPVTGTATIPEKASAVVEPVVVGVSTNQAAVNPTGGAALLSVPLTFDESKTPELPAPIDGIEGRRFNYTGAVPQAMKGGGVKGFLNLFNPFAKLTAAEKARATSATDRPLPRGFVDEAELEPVGLRIVSVETK